MSVLRGFDLKDRVAVVTGGAGLLGVRHTVAITQAGGHVVVADRDPAAGAECLRTVFEETGATPSFFELDVTNESAVVKLRDYVLSQFGRADILLNNAAVNPSVSADGLRVSGRLENFPVEEWNVDLAVSLTGAFLCSRTFGNLLSSSPHGGVILNISSDLGLVGPNQGLYRRSGVADEEQSVKPVSYSVVKAGLIGLTKYLATYWPGGAVRANALCPGGVQTDQSPEFLSKFAELVPMGRMADLREYEGAVLFMVSDASRYMNGAVVSVDGGRTAW